MKHYSIETALVYENPALLARYRKDYPCNTFSAEVAFRELKKYLWLCEKHRQDLDENPEETTLHFECNMYPEMAEIDDLWHTFLLFTQDYQSFCMNYLGRFVHHFPETELASLDPEIFETELGRYLSYVYDQLGEETLRLWFKEHCVQE